MNNYRVTAKTKSGLNYSFNIKAESMEQGLADAKKNAAPGHRVFLITALE